MINEPPGLESLSKWILCREAEGIVGGMFRNSSNSFCGYILL